MQQQLRQRRRGAQGVHRHRLARAAHADLLARRLRGAAPGRGARRGDPARVPRDDERAGGAAAEAVGRPARPVAARRRLGRAPDRAGRPRGARALGRRRVPPAARGARHRPASGGARRGPERLLRPGTGGSDHAYPARQRPPPHAGGHGRHRERTPLQRRRRAHGGRHGPRPPGRRALARSSSASTPATPPAAPASGSRSRASWPSAWTGGLLLRHRAAARRSRSSCPPTVRPREAHRWRRSLAAALLLLAAGCDANDDGDDASAASAAAARSRTTRVQVVEGLGREGGFDPAADLRPALAGRRHDPLDLQRRLEPARRRRRGRPGLRLRARRRRLHRHQRARGDHRRRPTAPSRRDQVYVEFSTATACRRRSSGTTRTPTSRCSRSTRRASRSRRSTSASRTRSRSGEPVAAIGSPFGERQSLSVGVISALDRTIESLTQFEIGDAIQTDAAINPGNSGGPLLDARGARDRHQRADQVAVGRRRGRGLRDPGRRRAPLAARAARRRAGWTTATSASRRSRSGRSSPSGSDVDVDTGALVQNVVDGSPAEDAGLEAGDERDRRSRARTTSPSGGDVIVAVDGKDLTARARPRRRDQPAAAPGDKVELTRAARRRAAHRRRSSSASRPASAGAVAPCESSSATSRWRCASGCCRSSARTRRGRTRAAAAGGDVTFAIDAEAERALEAFLARARARRGLLLRGPRARGARRRRRADGARGRPDRRHAPGARRARVLLRLGGGRAARRRSPTMGDVTRRLRRRDPVGQRLPRRARRGRRRGAARRGCPRTSGIDRMFWTYGFRGRPARPLIEVLGEPDRRLVGGRRHVRPRLGRLRHDARRHRPARRLRRARAADGRGRARHARGVRARRRRRGAQQLALRPRRRGADASTEAGAVVTDAYGRLARAAAPLLGSGPEFQMSVRRRRQTTRCTGRSSRPSMQGSHAFPCCREW